MRAQSISLFAVLTTAGLTVPGGSAAEPEKPKSIQPLVSLWGKSSKITAASYRRVESTDAWEKLWLEHQTGKADQRPRPDNFTVAKIDFERCMVIAVFDGESINISGFTVTEVIEDSERMVLRVQGRYYQSGIETPTTTAWGIFVVPKVDKPVVIEENVQNTIGQPPIWKKTADIKPGNAMAKR